MASIIRVPRIDSPGEDGSFVLVQIEPTGSHLLDLKLVGTEGESPYFLSVKHSSVQSFRSRNGQCDEDAWEKILQAMFRRGLHDEAEQVELVASVQEAKSITLTIRKNVQGITSRLGTLTLTHDESQEISLFDWTSLACLTTNSQNNDFIALQKQSTTQSATISALQAQLETLTTTKEAHETQLLQNFQALLNAKKAKIRDQQRLLAASTINPAAAARISSRRSREADSSRRGKRKAEIDSETDSGEDEVEKMDVVGRDGKGDGDGGVQMGLKEDSQAGSGDEGMRTPSEDDDETADEDDAPPVESKRAVRRPLRETRVGSVMAKVSSDNASGKQGDGDTDDNAPPPPIRTIPFQRKAAKNEIKPELPPVGEDEETTSEDDDEL